jgi:hypothetical protein
MLRYQINQILWQKVCFGPRFAFGIAHLASPSPASSPLSALSSRQWRRTHPQSEFRKFKSCFYTRQLGKQMSRGSHAGRTDEWTSSTSSTKQMGRSVSLWPTQTPKDRATNIQTRSDT